MHGHLQGYTYWGKPLAKSRGQSEPKKGFLAALHGEKHTLRNSLEAGIPIDAKLSKVALEAAEASAELSSKWTKETLAKLSSAGGSQGGEENYAKAMTDFATANAEMAAKNMAAFAEVAKKVQMETVELMLAAGREVSEETELIVLQATVDVDERTELTPEGIEERQSAYEELQSAHAEGYENAKALKRSSDVTHGDKKDENSQEIDAILSASLQGVIEYVDEVNKQVEDFLDKESH